MVTEQSTELCWLLTPETLQDRRSLHSIRCDNGLVSIYDVIRWVTGQQLEACQTIWARLLTAYPNMSTSCGSIKFSPKGRGRNMSTFCTSIKFTPKDRGRVCYISVAKFD